MPRKILHLDLDAFFCAVEEIRDPALRGKAFAVGGRPEERGVVSSCSYPARQHGVHSAMPTARALQLCPGLVVVPGRHGVYEEMSRQVMAHLDDLSHLVEQISIDEAFVDVSDLRAPGEAIARELQGVILRELNLPCSLGVAGNKLVAKIANTVGKARVRSGRPPMAITIVPPGEEATFLAPLPVGELWGVGPKTEEQLIELGLRTIGDLARQSPAEMARRFGKMGPELVERAQGRDDRPVTPEHEMKSLSGEITFAQDERDAATLRRVLSGLSEDVGRRLRHAELYGSTVKIKLRWSDFSTITRQITLPRPTNQDNDIYDAACELLAQARPHGKPVRLIGVGVSGLGPQAQQLELWETPLEKGQRLQEALDEVRERFGKHAIKRASDIEE
ncbi:MAG: DNA polymerase IV [Anaerolineae bacterium]|nr:DNA polymerase IV [Anaerolineae bacterium]